MASKSVVAKFELRIALGEAEAREALTEVLPHSDAAWQASALCAKVKGRASSALVLANENQVDDTIVVVHFSREIAGLPASTAFDVRVEPGPGVSPHVAADRLWRKLSTSRCLVHGRRGPSVVDALITAGTYDVLAGRTVRLREHLERPEFWLPIVSGVVALLVLVPSGQLVPKEHRPDAVWALVPFIVAGLVALVVAIARWPKEELLWSPT